MDKEEFRHLSLDLILPGGATDHSVRATRRWREANCPAFIRKEGWYLSSLLPKLNESLDCNLWVLLKKETSVKPHLEWTN